MKSPSTPKKVFSTTRAVIHIEDVTPSGYAEPLLDWEEAAEIGEYTTIFLYISTYLGLLLNVLHLFILTRKALRSNAVFCIMIAICVCDIMVFIGSITERKVVRWMENLVGADYRCGDSWNYWAIVVEWYSGLMVEYARTCAFLLALSMTLVRTLSVMLPMSRLVSKLTQLKYTVIMILLIFLLLVAWYAERIFKVKFTKQFDFVCYRADDERNKGFKVSAIIEGCAKIVLTVFYLLLTILLLVELQKTKRRRRNLKSEQKSENTSNLIMGMTISFLLSELFYSAAFIFITYDSYDIYDSSLQRIIFITAMGETYAALPNLNSIVHCLLCFFLSSQYREVVVECFLRKKKQTIMYLGEVKALYIVKGGIEMDRVLGSYLLNLFLVLVITSCTGPTVQYLQVAYILSNPSLKNHSLLRLTINAIPLTVAVPTAILIYLGYNPSPYEIEISETLLQEVTEHEDSSFLIAPEEKIMNAETGVYDYDTSARVCTFFMFTTMALSIIIVIACFTQMQTAMMKKQSVTTPQSMKSHKQLNLLLIVQFVFPFLTIHIPFYTAFMLPFADIEFETLSSHLPYLFAWCPALNPLLVIFMVKNVRDTLTSGKKVSKSGATFTSSHALFVRVASKM